MQPKWLTRILICLLAPLAGCDGPPTIGDRRPAKPFAGRELTVACDDPVGLELLRLRGRIWEARTGAELTVIDRPFDPDTADAGLIDPIDLPALAEADRLAVVPESVREDKSAYDWPKLLPIYRYRLAVWSRRGQPVAVPVLGEGRVLVYRSDLFAEEEHRDAFRSRFRRELGVPHTWEELADVGEYFTGALGRPALTPLPKSADELARLFFTVAASYDKFARQAGEVSGQGDGRAFSFHYDMGTMRPRIDRPAFRHALEWFRRTRAYRPDAPSGRPWEAFRDGDAVAAVVPLRAVAEFQNAPELKDRFGIAALPGARFVFDDGGGRIPAEGGVNRLPYFGGGLLGVVAEQSPKGEMAWSLLTSMSDPEGSDAVIAEPSLGGGPLRTTHTDRDHQAGWYAYGLDTDRTGQLIEAMANQFPINVGNPVSRLRIPTARQHIAALEPPLREAIASDVPASEALARAAEAWAKLDAGLELGLDERREQYRTSLGLVK